MSRVLDDAEYAATTAALVRLAGLVFDDSRRAALSAIVHDRIERTDRGGVHDYLAWVSSPEGVAERQLLLDAVTIQETHFFRNQPQIDALRRTVLPELVARARSERRPLTIWSAGCSTGEEPYTLAMVLLQLMAGSNVPVRIVGTDVSAAALAVAESGVYSGRTIELAEAGAAQRWFAEQPGGAFSVLPAVRELVEFRLHNLVTEEPPADLGRVDLVVCRNVTIYFSRETTRALVNRFHQVLVPGGYLLLGHAETLWQISDAFTLVPVGEAFAYRRDRHSTRPGHRPVGPAPAPPPPPAPGAATRSLRARLRAPVRLPRRSPPPPAPSWAPSPNDDLVAARAALVEGRYQEAATLAARATAAHPLLAAAYVVEGRALANLSDHDGTIAALRKAIFLDPSAGDAHFLLATALARAGDPSAAARSFATAAQTLPNATPERLTDLLDGRAVSDLVDLCRQLVADLQQSDPAVPPQTAGRSTR